MLAFAIRRLGQSLSALVLMSFLVFLGVCAIGNPIELPYATYQGAGARAGAMSVIRLPPE